MSIYRKERYTLTKYLTRNLNNQKGSSGFFSYQQKRFSSVSFIILIMIQIFTMFSSQVSAEEKITLQLKWQHQFQFAGYYAAKAQGYYQEAGLDVDILPCQPDKDPTKEVVEGRAQFGVGASDLLLNREKGDPIVVLAAIFQHSPMAFITLKNDELQTIHDLNNNKVMLEQDSAELLAYLRQERINIDNITIIPHSYEVKDLISGKVYAISAYVTDEPFIIGKAGKDYMLYSPRAVGIDFYSDNLFTTEKMIKEQPDVVKKFREASLKGWDYAMKNQEEIAHLIFKQYTQRHSEEHLLFEAKQMEQLLQASLVEIGHMNRGRWQHIVETYADLSMIKKDFKLNGFLYDPNPAPPDFTWLYIYITLSILIIALISSVTIYISKINIKLRKEITEHEKTQQELQKAFDDIKTLRGVVPICANCKKIRDDKGYWEQVDVYIRNHTEATFSHSMCPECYSKFYPDLKQGKRNSDKNHNETDSSGE